MLSKKKSCYRTIDNNCLVCSFSFISLFSFPPPSSFLVSLPPLARSRFVISAPTLSNTRTTLNVCTYVSLIAILTFTFERSHVRLIRNLMRMHGSYIFRYCLGTWYGQRNDRIRYLGRRYLVSFLRVRVLHFNNYPSLSAFHCFL